MSESILRNAALASGLVSSVQLDYAVRLARHRLTSEGAPPTRPIEDRYLADLLVEQQILTPYQADQLCAGRTKMTLGPYLITDWIGQGGMGQVFKAVHQVMGRVCAVKVLPVSRATEEARSSFAREIRMQAKLDCPHLVRAYDAGMDGSVHYLVTEYVPGMDLRRLIRIKGPLSPPQAASIIMQAAVGIAHAHEVGLIHRDVKPGNILVTPEGIAKVSDVGLAGFAADLLDDPRAGKIIGTADYLSPEQIRSPLEVGPESDIYSLGCTLYYAVCGKVPFPGGDTNSKLRRHVSDTPWHPRKFAPDLSEEFVDIIADMMEKDPKKRIKTANEVASRLQAFSGDAGELTSQTMSRSPWLAPPPPAVEPEPAPYPTTYPATWDALIGNQQDSGLGGSGGSSGAATSQPGQLPLPDSFPVLTPPPQTMDKRMLIALTTAIVLPPTLLVGAILGYLVHQYLMP